MRNTSDSSSGGNNTRSAWNTKVQTLSKIIQARTGRDVRNSENIEVDFVKIFNMKYSAARIGLSFNSRLSVVFFNFFNCFLILLFWLVKFYLF